jgi:hypothetical protein
MARQSGSSGAAKAEREKRVFLAFAKHSSLPVDLATVESRNPPEPDIRCFVHGAGEVAFELAEICNPELAKDIGDQGKRGTKAKFHMLDDPSRSTFLSKLTKTYKTDAPIELILYTGRTAVPDNLSLPMLRDLAASWGLAPIAASGFWAKKLARSSPIARSTRLSWSRFRSRPKPIRQSRAGRQTPPNATPGAVIH